MEQEVLEKLQRTETEMLSVLDDYCEKRGIAYSLMFGTLLGAVRHHGPIPWDDDVDIIMDRDNYAKFMASFEKEPMDGFFLQKEGPDTKSTINHMKLRKDGTVLGNRSDIEREEHSGIWIDIFVFDRVPTDKRKRKKLLTWNKLRMIYTRGYPPKKAGKATRAAVRLMLLLPKSVKKRLRIKSEKEIRKFENCTGEYELCCLASPDNAGYFFPRDVIQSIEETDYCGHKLKIFSAFDAVLRIRYGDYMQLPPENERVCRHNPNVIRFE